MKHERVSVQNLCRVAVTAHTHFLTLARIFSRSFELMPFRALETAGDATAAGAAAVEDDVALTAEDDVDTAAEDCVAAASPGFAGWADD